MTIRAPSFDADGTLWDVKVVMTQALEVVLKELKTRFPSSIAQSLTVERLIEIRNQVATEMSDPRKRPTKSFLTDVRRAALIRTVEMFRLGDTAFGEELTDLYFARRWAPTELFPDVLPVLSNLQEDDTSSSQVSAKTLYPTLGGRGSGNRGGGTSTR